MNNAFCEARLILFMTNDFLIHTLKKYKCQINCVVIFTIMFCEQSCMNLLFLSSLYDVSGFYIIY